MEDFCGLSCPPLDFGFDLGELGGFDYVEDGGVSLDNFFDNVEIDGDEARIDDDAFFKNPNPALKVKQQRSGKDMRLLIKNPETTVVHGKGKQLPPPPENIVSGQGKELPLPPIRHGKGKQFKILQQVHDPNYHSTSNHVIHPSIEISVPNVDSVNVKTLTMKKTISHGKGKQFKTLQQAHDPNYHSTSKVIGSTDHVIDPSVEISVPKVESTKRTVTAKPDSTKTVLPDSVSVSVSGIDYEYKLEVSKRKLQESYGAAQQAKRQRQISVLDSEKPRLQHRSCQGQRFRTKKLQRLYNHCKSRPCLIL